LWSLCTRELVLRPANTMVQYGKLLEQVRGVSPADWKEHWIDYHALKKLIYEIHGQKKQKGGGNGSSRSGSEEADSSAGEGTAAAAAAATTTAAMNAAEKAAATAQKSRQFFERLRREVNTVSAFYNAKEKELLARVSTFMDAMIEARVQFEEATSSSSTSHADRPCIQSMSGTFQTANGIYTELLMLENFAVMNYGGVCKILKKHDKNTDMTTRVKYINRVLNAKPFAVMAALKQVIPVIEHQVQRLMSALEEQGVADTGGEVAGGAQNSRRGESSDGEPSRHPRSAVPSGFNSKEVNVLNLLHNFASEGREIVKNTPLVPHDRSPIAAAIMAGAATGAPLSRREAKRKLTPTATDAADGGNKIASSNDNNNDTKNINNNNMTKQKEKRRRKEKK
jgi:hypothetical protein